MCVGKSSCVLVPNEEASKANLNPSDMCVRDHYGEATALAVQATCSVETSIVELRAEVCGWSAGQHQALVGYLQSQLVSCSSVPIGSAWSG